MSDVRFASKSRHPLVPSACPLCANKRDIADLTDYLVCLHPTICSSHGMSALPVHFQSFNVCGRADAFIDASSNVVAESINAPESAARTIPLTDHPSETAAQINKIAKAWRD
jgi:hypothetical protein